MIIKVYPISFLNENRQLMEFPIIEIQENEISHFYKMAENKDERGFYLEFDDEMVVEQNETLSESWDAIFVCCCAEFHNNLEKEKLKRKEEQNANR